MVEKQSRGKALDAAFIQGNDYFHGLTNNELPRCSSTIVHNNFPWPSVVNVLPKSSPSNQALAQSASVLEAPENMASTPLDAASTKLIAKIEAAA